MNLCQDCTEADCKHRNNNATVCGNYKEKKFSYREYLKKEKNKEMLTHSFIDGWARYCDGRIKSDLIRKGFEVPEFGFVPSNNYTPCKPQEAYAILKIRLGDK